MARHRRPLVDGPPLELFVFRADDWVSDDGVLPLERWHKARFEWAKAHPEDFSLGGDALDMLRERVAYRRQLLPSSVFPLTVSTVSTIWRGALLSDFAWMITAVLDVQGLDVLAA